MNIFKGFMNFLSNLGKNHKNQKDQDIPEREEYCYACHISLAPRSIRCYRCGQLTAYGESWKERKEIVNSAHDMFGRPINGYPRDIDGDY